METFTEAREFVDNQILF